MFSQCQVASTQKMTFGKLVFAIVILYHYVHAAPRVDPLVDSKVGLIRGLRASDGDYSMFLGIPYAKVDEGNPFGPSTSHPIFEDTFEAFDDSAVCPQIEEINNTITGTIDCLRLNVYVPTAATSSNRLPVLVWIHGGGFETGSGGRYVYGPKFLVRHDIVFVTVNYRLGPYGFMCLDTPNAPGNQGLRDQQLALEWVKNNIEAFGGDANKITLFGESAGSASVDFHIHSAAENLFHQAIMQSGTTLNPWVMRNPGNEGPLKLAGHLGFETVDVNSALSFLSTVDSSLVMAATKELGLSFRVCVENNFEGVVPFVADYPVNLNAPKIKKVPLLIGFNNDEGLYYHAHTNNWNEIDVIGDAVKSAFDFDDQNFSIMSELLKHFYFGDDDINDETRGQVLNLSSDFNYVHPTQRILKRYFGNGAETVYSYVFSYDGERNLIKHRNNITIGGAAHADEISYLFDVSYMRDIMSEEEQVVIDRMTTLWTNFVKYGNPIPDTTDLVPLKWDPASKEKWHYLNIDSELSMKSRPFHDRVTFLNLFFKMNEKYLIGYHDRDV